MTSEEQVAREVHIAKTGRRSEAHDRNQEEERRPGDPNDESELELVGGCFGCIHCAAGGKKRAEAHLGPFHEKPNELLVFQALLFGYCCTAGLPH